MLNKKAMLLFILLLGLLVGTGSVQAAAGYQIQLYNDVSVLVAVNAAGDYVIKDAAGVVLGFVAKGKQAGQFDVYDAKKTFVGTATNLNPQALNFLLPKRQLRLKWFSIVLDNFGFEFSTRR